LMARALNPKKVARTGAPHDIWPGRDACAKCYYTCPTKPLAWRSSAPEPFSLRCS
jgi:hypothetical protein